MNNENKNNIEESEEDEEDEELEENEDDKASDSLLNKNNLNKNNQNVVDEKNTQESLIQKEENKNENKNIKNDKNLEEDSNENIKQKDMKKDIELSINKENKEEINKENFLNESNDNNSNSNEIKEKNDIIIPKKTNNNKYIYTTYQNNIFYVDETDDSSPDNYKKSFSKKKLNNSINSKSIYKRTLSISENEEIESSENETESYEEESEEKDDISNNINSLNNSSIEKDCYLLELNDNGLPNIQNDEIISCKINSLINISLNNGISISKDIFMITNAENEFPSPFFLNSLINEIKIKNDKIPNDDYTYNLSLKHQKYLNNLNEDNNILKQTKKYQIFPNRINTKIYFKINCKVSGNVTFIFLYKSSENNLIQLTKPFHILVNPLININNKIIEINQLQMQSVIPKNIGNLEKDFDKFYLHVSLLGYNFIHFHSFQKLSKDENIFLIKDQNDLNDRLFLNESNSNNNDITNINTKQKYQLLLNSIKNLKNKYSIGSITDIILNQTSSESSWIFENKDCTYNLKNTPWLNVAYELDQILMEYSYLFKNKKVLCKSAPYIYNINDIEEIISEINTLIEKNELEQYFMINEEKYLNEFKEFYSKLKNEEFNKNFYNKKNIILNDLVKNCENKEKKLAEIFTDINYLYKLILQCCINYGYERFGVKICTEFIAIIILQSFKEVNKINKLPTENIFLNDVKNIINIINQKWKKQIKELLKLSLSNIKENLKYKYLQLKHNKKIDQLIDSYFIIKNKNDPSEIFLSNGWLMESNDNNNNSLYINTVKYGAWHHLKRNIIINKNSIKINYGENIENTSLFLINHITEYISNLAFIFDGLYIDSIRYIPINILKYFIYVARKVNPSIILMSNITTKVNNISVQIKKKYTEELGINLFINELIWNNTINETINSLIKDGSSKNSNIYSENITHFNSELYSSSFVGENKILLGKYKSLKPKKPLNILYDSFDNKTYYEKFKKLSLSISISSLLSLLDTSIGSTFGIDQMHLQLPRIENENRQYELNKDIKDLITKIDEMKIKGEEKLEVFLEYHPNETQPFNNNNSINSIHIAINIYDYEPKIELTKITNNLYMTKISIPPGKYYFQYLINNEIWTYDNTQPMVEDENGIIYNTIDLRNQNKIIIPDFEIYKRELNKVRNYFTDKKSEIYFQKNQDMCGIIRMIMDDRTLINNNIEKNKIESFKNILSEDTQNEEENDESNQNDNENSKETNINQNSNKLKLSKNELLSKSFEYLNNLDKNIILNENKSFVNSIEKNTVQNESNKSKTLNSTNDKSSLNSTKNDVDLTNSNNFEVYDGYAIICFPYFDNDRSKKGKGKIIIPGKISMICGCYLPEKNIMPNISEIIMDKKLKGSKNEVIFTKDINYLKSIAKIKYIENQTIIEFFNAPQNISFIFKFKNDCAHICDDLNNYLEILLNNGNDLINYFDETDINQLLYGNENEGYEMKINLFKIINDSNRINNNNKLKYKFMYSGINQLMELIKIIKKTENQDLFLNNKTNNISDQFENEYDFINSINDRKVIAQSLYKDIYTNDNCIKYLIDVLSKAKSFNLIYNFIKKIIYPKYKLLPNFIKPRYIEKIFTSIYQNIIKISLGKIPKYLLNFGELSIGLSLTRYQFIKSSIHSPFDDKLIDLYSSEKKQKKNNYQTLLGLTIINGLPLRNNNMNKISTRDLLFSFNSLFLIPKLFFEAKLILKLIGSTMKYGLFPDYIENNENNFIYNSLDISWLYIRAIKEYISQSQDYNLLKENIYLINVPENIDITYLKIKDKNKTTNLSVENIIQLIFQYHAQGIKYNDKNDENKVKLKKNDKAKRPKSNQNNDLINIILDYQTGFIFKKSVNVFDKNIKIRANSKYKADIEIISLLYDCINFVIGINNNNYYPYKDVILPSKNKLSFYEWSLLIKKSFEKEFITNDKFIKSNFIIKNFDNNNNEKVVKIIKEKKESTINKKMENEFKLNQNILLAICYSPYLFSKEVIIQSIDYIEKYFLMDEIISTKTEDSMYKLKGIKVFDKSNNYQEYTYLYGIYLTLKINYFYNLDSIYENSAEIIRYISKKLYPYIQYMKESNYMGLPEIIEEDGNVSEDGNKSDLKSFSIIYELIEKISHICGKSYKMKENDEDLLYKNS